MSARYTKTITDLKKKNFFYIYTLICSRKSKYTYLSLFLSVLRLLLRLLDNYWGIKNVSFLFFVLTMGRLILFGQYPNVASVCWRRCNKHGKLGRKKERKKSKTISRRFISLDTASEFRLVEFSREVYRVIGSWPSRSWERWVDFLVPESRWARRESAGTCYF